MNNRSVAAEADLWIEFCRSQEAIAQAADCGVPDCDREAHVGIDPLKWSHRVHSKEVAGQRVVIFQHGTELYSGYVDLFEDDFTADALREKAASLVAVATEMALLADRIDGLNKAVA